MAHDTTANTPRRHRGPLRSTPHSLTESDAASYIGMSRAFLRQGRQHGRGPAYVRIGRAIRYRRSDLDTWLDAHRVDPHDVAHRDHDRYAEASGR